VVGVCGGIEESRKAVLGGSVSAAYGDDDGHRNIEWYELQSLERVIV
jgi:hypothetical protein